MSRNPWPVCCWCGKDVPHGGRDVLEVPLDQAGGPRIVMRWHLRPTACAEADPLHDALATALGLPDGEAGADEIARAYTAIRDRAEERGNLRAAIAIPRDMPSAKVTLRRADAWGRLAER